MKMRTVVGCAIYFILAASWYVAGAIDADLQARMSERGYLALSDGSSCFIFRADHSFEMLPLGLSGRTIHGKWSLTDRVFVVEGRWGCVNGHSFEGDFRSISLAVGALDGQSYEVEILAAGKLIVEKAYFTIESLTNGPNQALQTTPMTRSVYEKTIEFGSPQRGV